MIRKVFYNPYWGIAWRYINRNESALAKNVNYKNINNFRDCYYADPFCFEDKNKNMYIFAEYMKISRGIGSIAVAKIENGKISAFTECIKEDFHMSYPNVFEYNDEYYMIPESCAAKQLILYKATQFPYKWEKNCVLIDNIRCVDTSFFVKKDGRYLYIFDDELKKTSFYKLDMEKKCVIPVEAEYAVSDERPAGNVFNANGKFYRATQDCDEEYGRRMFVYCVDESSDKFYSETQVGMIDINSFALEPKLRHVEKTHTLNRVGNIEVIDYLYWRFCITKPFKRIMEKIRDRSC